MNSQNAQIVLNALHQKFPAMPNVRSLSDEQKAWLQMKIQLLADCVAPSQALLHLQKIGKRLMHATEDIPDDEMQRIVSFVFDNMGEIENAVGRVNHGKAEQ